MDEVRAKKSECRFLLGLLNDTLNWMRQSERMMPKGGRRNDRRHPLPALERFDRHALRELIDQGPDKEPLAGRLAIALAIARLRPRFHSPVEPEFVEAEKVAMHQ
ncbi:hypothetical protein L6654_34795 [Bradyrhizobium sp. WYCCWR 13023]|uniref:Uncharacterized protein n=1 Tax=Bradyrhizobium zhengyangense TaxID=2911009 RepID=A0A9X1RJH3_9BRAD|nr:hypothetical protein [Bradyrhizobium zhengyangense]MCG2631809.1 hypothetical protein [Bradyrhizobium zhengyangense]